MSSPDPFCGLRCDRCGEPMCADYGPEPADTCPVHIECRPCSADNTCRDCADIRREVAA